MIVLEAETRLAELLDRYRREAGAQRDDRFDRICQINGSHNRVVFHVHYACCEAAFLKPIEGCWPATDRGEEDHVK